MFQDILRETDIYQIIMEEGREEGLQALHQTLLGFVQARFPQLVSFATKQTSHITDIQMLKDLTLKIGLAQTIEEVRQLLTQAGNTSKN